MCTMSLSWMISQGIHGFISFGRNMISSENSKNTRLLGENQIKKKSRFEDKQDGKFYGKEIEEFCKHYSIARKKNKPYTPEWNGVNEERIDVTLMEKVRSMFIDVIYDRNYRQRKLVLHVTT